MQVTAPDSSARALLIKKLLNKAEAAGTTQHERDAFNEKAAELMIQWGIEEAMLIDTDRLEVEKIIQVQFQTDAPKSYSFEVTSIGISICRTFSCQGFFQRKADGRTNLTVVGFERDVNRVRELFVSLTRQARLDMASAYASINWESYATGGDKFNWKRSFLIGFSDGVRRKLELIYRQTIADAEAATPGTELVLVDRKRQVSSYIETEMKLGISRQRKYTHNGTVAGINAGLKADVGGTQVKA